VVPLFLPQIIRALGVSIQMTAFASAVPFVFALAAMLYFSSRSDYSGNRTRYAATALVLASVGPAAAAIIGINHPILMLVALTVGIMGAQSVAPLFWPIPTAMLSGLAAAGSVALINSVGNVAGLIAPTVFGIMKDATGSDMIAVLTICPTPLISVVILLLVGHDRRTERIPSRG
jgi:MFS family permease